MTDSTDTHPQGFKTQTLSRPALYTDYYELTMAQGYFKSGRTDEVAVFDYFFRDLPFDGGYVVFAGISDLLEILADFTFHSDELEFLAEQGFDADFIDYLRDFRFGGTIHAAREGEVVFPYEPLVRIKGSIIETQILETIVLNILNFESLIATKAARIKQAAGDRKVIDFGLRRAQGLGGIQASKAAVIGGAEATSNVYAAHRHGLPVSGTMAHSWIQSFDSELEAFRTFSEYYPDNCVLLVDTYDTLGSGLPNAIKTAREMEKKGHRLLGIRLDSGDLAYFSKKSRNILDSNGLDYVKISASNQLDERIIQSLISQDAPIDLFGVGTRLVTGHETPALDGVYKLSSVNDSPRLKISENIEKVTLPGQKDVLRYSNADGRFYADGILLSDEDEIDRIYHPHYQGRHTGISDYQYEPLLEEVMNDGELRITPQKPEESASYANQQLSHLEPEYRRFDNPHIYKVGISKKLMNLRNTLTQKLKKPGESR